MASSSDESLHLGFFEDAANTTTPESHHGDSSDLPTHSEETESLPGDPARDVLSPSTPPPSDVAGSRTSDTYPVMKAIANVRPRHANELRLKKDDLLEIITQYDADWLVVKLIANQRLGMVKLCNVAPATPAEQRISPIPSSSNTTLPQVASITASPATLNLGSLPAASIVTSPTATAIMTSPAVSNTDSPPESIYKEEDIHAIKWTFMVRHIASQPLKLVLRLETSSKPASMPLHDFYMAKGIISRFFPDQQTVMRSSVNGEDFDITLLYRCIRWGSDGQNLATSNREILWNEGSSSLESKLTQIKNYRNEIAHKDLKYTQEAFLDRTEALRTLLTQTLQSIAILYSINTEKETREMSEGILKYRDNDIEDQDLKVYKRFRDTCKMVEKKGKESTIQQYKQREDTKVQTVNHIIEISFPVEDIYTEMEMGEEIQPNKQKVTYQDLLKCTGLNYSSQVLVLVGQAGVGKTTLLKKLLSDYITGSSVMTDLDTYKLVLHCECRSQSINSCIRLLRARMPALTNSLTDEEIRTAALHLKIMIIFDGLDEINEASGTLFEEVLELKKDFSAITVLITTRPEKLKFLQSRLQAQHLMMQHITVKGIPREKRQAFVLKYHSKMEERQRSNHSQDVRSVDGLLAYLNKTEHSLANIWYLPYNLALVTVLYVIKELNLENITTAPELYREIHDLYRLKLKERLRSLVGTKHLHDSEFDKIIDVFLYQLAKESLMGLMKDQIQLPLEAYQNLEHVCASLKVPVEEMVSAFLKQVPTGLDVVIYGFPHKGLQDYLSAQYIWMHLTGDYQSTDVQKVLTTISTSLNLHTVPSFVSQNIVRFAEKELKSKSITANSKVLLSAKETSADGQSVLPIQGNPSRSKPHKSTSSHGLRDKIARITRVFRKKSDRNVQPLVQDHSIIMHILNEIHNESSLRTQSQSSLESAESISDFGIEKLQNVFMHLIGLLHHEGAAIPDEIKLEILQLLQKTGVKDREAWLNILSSVKCDDFVTDFISKQQQIMEARTEINDANLNSSMAILNALKKPSERDHEIRLNLNITGEFKTCKVLTKEIARLKLKVEKILITDDNFDEYLAVLQVLKRHLTEDHEIALDIDEDSTSFTDLLSMIINLRLSISTVTIYSSNIDVYIQHLQDMKLPLTKHHKLQIHLLSVPPAVLDHLKRINTMKLNVTELVLDEHFRNIVPLDPSWQEEITHILHRCPVEVYEGSFLQMCSWPLTLKEVTVSVGNAEDYLRLQQEVSVGRLQGIQYLGLWLPHQQLIASEVTESLPNIKSENGNEATEIFLPDLDSPSDVAGVVGLVKALMPHPGKLGLLTFPRCSLTLQDILCLTQQLAGSNVKVNGALFFPSDDSREKRRRDPQHPGNSPQEIKREIMKIAKEQIGALGGVYWGNVPSLNIWTDDW